MADNTSLDLARLDAWHGVRPGMTRTQVQEVMQQQGVETQKYGNDTLFATTDDWEMELEFTTDGADRLWQVTLSGDSILWNGQALADARLDDALRHMGSPASAVWQSNKKDPSSTSYDAAEPPPTDEELLEDGTVWIPERALGLVVSQGEVFEVAWRDPRDLPARYGGPVSEVQRQLSQRDDLESHLQEKRTKLVETKLGKDPVAPFRTLLTVAAIAAIALTAKLGFEDMQRWNAAPTLPAKVVALEKHPMKQFRDFLPPALRWMFPALRNVIVDHYRVEFTVPGEELPRQALLERSEFYVTPDKPGEGVQVVFVAGDPPRTKGPFRARDSAFVDYTPWVIAIGALWLILFFGLGLAPAGFRIGRRLVKMLAPAGVVKDPDRPELR